MAKDDYRVIVYKILLYYYACLKGKIVFDKTSFYAAIKNGAISDEYLTRALKMMSSDGLLDGLVFAKAWGSEVILASELSDARITAKGVEYISENSAMKKVRQAIIDTADITASLIGIVGI